MPRNLISIKCTNKIYPTTHFDILAINIMVTELCSLNGQHAYIVTFLGLNTQN